MGENLSTTEIQTVGLSRFLILFKIIILPNEIEYVNTTYIKLSFKTIKRGIGMEFKVKLNKSAKYGYELLVTHDDGTTEVRPLNQKTTDGYLRLPQDVYDATNKHYVSLKMLESLNGDDYVIETQVTKRNNKSKNSTTSARGFSMLDWLDDNDKETYNALMKKALHAYNVAQITKQIDALEAQKAALLG